MRTVSWLHDGKGYQLLCNRDGKKTRLPARGPRIESLDGVQFVAPRDGDSGGTWIAANEFGLTVCLLNRPGPDRPRSRGLVVSDLAGATSLNDADVRLGALALHRTCPFTVVMATPGGNTLAALASGLGIHASLIGVTTAPGPTAFTRMLRSAYSSAKLFVRFSKPPLLTEYGRYLGFGMISWTRELFRITPPTPRAERDG